MQTKSKSFGKFLRISLICCALTFAVNKSNPQEQSLKSLSALQCLTTNIFYEARNQNKIGMQAVAAVTYNRAASGKYPSSVCRVVFQKMQFSWTHQIPYKEFSKVLEGDLSGYSSKDKAKYQQALEIAQKPVNAVRSILPSNTLHYHAAYVNPKWKYKMTEVRVVGSHVFYKENPKVKRVVDKS